MSKWGIIIFMIVLLVVLASTTVLWLADKYRVRSMPTYDSVAQEVVARCLLEVSYDLWDHCRESGSSDVSKLIEESIAKRCYWMSSVYSGERVYVSSGIEDCCERLYLSSSIVQCLENGREKDIVMYTSVEIPGSEQNFIVAMRYDGSMLYAVDMRPIGEFVVYMLPSQLLP